MATIIDLKEHLENGGKIRRPFWKEGEWIRIFNHAFVDNACVGFPFLPEDALYCDWEVYREPFEITHTGIYKTRGGRQVYISYIEIRFVYGVFEGEINIQNWNVDGSLITGEKSDDDIVSEWEN